MDDIFKGDSKIDSSEKQESFKSALSHLGRGIKLLFFSKFSINLFLLIIIMILSASFSYWAKPQYVEAADNCTEAEPCPECPECEPCARTNCSDCPERNIVEYVYRYICPKGGIVNSSEDCIQLVPDTEPEYTSTSNGVSISLDSIEYELDNGTVKIRKINYTVINQGREEILPEIGLKVYDKYTTEIKQGHFIRTFIISKLLEPGDWIKRSENVIVDYDLSEGTVRLELIDSLPDPDELITVVYRRFDFSE